MSVNTLPPYESYTIILKHEYNEPDGTRVLMEEPFVCRSTYFLQDRTPTIFALNEICDHFKAELLRRAERSEE